MCGIAGVIDFTGKGQLPAYITQMTQRLRHRGPDDEGFTFFRPGEWQTAGGPDTPATVWQSPQIYTPRQPVTAVQGNFKAVLGHRRLSIISPGAEGHQPFCSPDQNLWLVFNGEIYNYQELRAELIALGFSFLTNTDTEVVLTAYRAWGEACQHRFNGMWALAIYNRQTQSLFLSRDRFGVKPLYYYQGQGFFAFASEQKALVPLPFVRTGINQGAAFDYLVLSQYSLQEQLFQNIQELQPAHALTVTSGGKVTWQRFYSLGTSTQPADFDPVKATHYAQEIQQMLKDSVRLRLRADVPVGACLSGGLDSSSIVALMQHLKPEPQLGHQVNVFTACFAGSAIDESHWAQQVAQATDARWHAIRPQAQDLLANLETLVYAHDIPFFNSSSYAQFAVMQAVKAAGIKVTLDGQGADELFAGYFLHYLPLWRELGSRGQIRQLWSEMQQSPLWGKPLKGLGVQVLKNTLRQSPFLFRQTARFTQGAEGKLLNQGFVRRHSAFIHQKDAFTFTSLNQTMAQYFTGWYLQMLLRNADRNAMWASVEARTPFVDDHRLVEYVFGLPAVYKMRHGQTKYLLRESMKGILPEAIRTRKDKIGFATPEAAWLPQFKDELKSYFTPDLQEFIQTDVLLKNWDAVFAHAAQHDTNRLWRMINFAVWKKVYGL